MAFCGANLFVGCGDVQVNEAFEGCLEGGGRVEAVGAQDIGNAAIEAFDSAIGLGPSGLDQAVFDMVIGADPIEGRRRSANVCRWRRSGR